MAAAGRARGRPRNHDSQAAPVGRAKGRTRKHDSHMTVAEGAGGRPREHDSHMTVTGGAGGRPREHDSHMTVTEGAGGRPHGPCEHDSHLAVVRKARGRPPKEYPFLLIETIQEETVGIDKSNPKKQSLLNKGAGRGRQLKDFPVAPLVETPKKETELENDMSCPKKEPRRHVEKKSPKQIDGQAKQTNEKLYKYEPLLQSEEGRCQRASCSVKTEPDTESTPEAGKRTVNEETQRDIQHFNFPVLPSLETQKTEAECRKSSPEKQFLQTSGSGRKRSGSCHLTPDVPPECKSRIETSDQPFQSGVLMVHVYPDEAESCLSRGPGGKKSPYRINDQAKHTLYKIVVKEPILGYSGEEQQSEEGKHEEASCTIKTGPDIESGPEVPRRVLEAGRETDPSLQMVMGSIPMSTKIKAVKQAGEEGPRSGGKQRTRDLTATIPVSSARKITYKQVRPPGGVQVAEETRGSSGTRGIIVSKIIRGRVYGNEDPTPNRERHRGRPRIESTLTPLRRYEQAKQTKEKLYTVVKKTLLKSSEGKPSHSEVARRMFEAGKQIDPSLNGFCRGSIPSSSWHRAFTPAAEVKQSEDIPRWDGRERGLTLSSLISSTQKRTATQKEVQHTVVKKEQIMVQEEGEEQFVVKPDVEERIVAQDEGEERFVVMPQVIEQVVAQEEGNELFVVKPEVEEQFVVKPEVEEQFVVKQEEGKEQFVVMPQVEEQVVAQEEGEEQFVVMPQVIEQVVAQEEGKEQFVAKLEVKQTLVQEEGEEQFVVMLQVEEQIVAQKEGKEQFVVKQEVEEQFVAKQEVEEQFVAKQEVEEQFVAKQEVKQTLVQEEGEEQFVVKQEIEERILVLEEVQDNIGKLEQTS
ncbi:inner centromere protein-like [Haliotis cracherodii]|uniref:inner centromere protein-like n=1 Tax=Haliotis cracherodii TaxID=6455 RepID=UPI0039ED6F7A